ncbi:efflux RND transporter periplasmic adaptor subunit [Pacificimonas sp. WHA3]|uniref:Efflux RND transporter periplasmic adaptor subunit n=1 Tax=Pacificimonas pallii TaxID=2827236 RepID=A0ABS6SF37_9SPHN|nr:efflux RND transporter periplasmic adaptor subunit [Pacificimonas pallii]MBV7256713.1 efflux RND transporter periplasmic adaptor subunit [Pacificimonas pallii]
MRASLAGLLLLAACSGDASEDENAAIALPPPVIKVAEVGNAAFRATTEVVGTVRLADEADLAFTTSGRIKSLTVRSGDRVSKGQLLAQLDMTTVSADVSAARAEQRRASRSLERSRKLFADGWVTQARLDEAVAAVQAADARVQSSGFAARTAKILAPADGVILDRRAEPGQTVAGGAPVLLFGSEARGYVLVAPLTDRLAADRRIGETASVSIPALGDTSIRAELVELSGRADGTTGTFDAEFRLGDHAGLRSGQVGRVRLSTQESSRAVTIPPGAIFAARAGEALVWVYDAATQTVVTRSIVPGPLSNDGVRVLSGLETGEFVVTAGLDDLQQDMKVRAN